MVHSLLYTLVAKAYKALGLLKQSFSHSIVSPLKKVVSCSGSFSFVIWCSDLASFFYQGPSTHWEGSKACKNLSSYCLITLLTTSLTLLPWAFFLYLCFLHISMFLLHLSVSMIFLMIATLAHSTFSYSSVSMIRTLDLVDSRNFVTNFLAYLEHHPPTSIVFLNCGIVFLLLTYL